MGKYVDGFVTGVEHFFTGIFVSEETRGKMHPTHLPKPKPPTHDPIAPEAKPTPSPNPTQPHTKPKPKPHRKPVPDETSTGRQNSKAGCGKCTRTSKPWSISSKGLNFLKNYETLQLKMYNDSAGHATIGYGHLIHLGSISGQASEKPFKNGLTKEQASALLKQDLSKYEQAVNDNVKMSLCQQEYDALVIFYYNIGIHGFGSSSALKEINKKHYHLVGSKMKLWNKAGGKVSRGLQNRRAEEVEIFEKGDYVRTR